MTTDIKGGVCPPLERTRVDKRRFKVHAKTRSQKESNLLANLCDTVAFRWFRAVNDSRVAAPSQGGGRRAGEWRIWRTSSGATPTAMLSVKVGSTGLRGRVARRAFCGRSPTAVRFPVCERSDAAGEWWHFLVSCLSAPCTPGGASVPWRAPIE